VRDLDWSAPARHQIDVHRRLLEGLQGESLLISSSMFLNSLAEAERFFDISFKTLKSKIGKCSGLRLMARQPPSRSDTASALVVAAVAVQQALKDQHCRAALGPEAGPL
jgi:hypothetical protein